MKVKTLRNKYVNCPSEVAKYGSPTYKTDITIGRAYEVCAIVMFDGSLSFQIVNDANFIEWERAWLFEIIDTSIPNDWICNWFTGGRLQMVMGPKFIAADEASYNSMVELDAEPVSKFWERFEDIAKKEQLVKTLLDKDAPLENRYEAAEDLAIYPNEKVSKALISIASDSEDICSEVSGESAAKIWVKLNYLNMDDYKKLIPIARKVAYTVIKNDKPEWIDTFKLKEVEIL